MLRSALESLHAQQYNLLIPGFTGTLAKGLIWVHRQRLIEFAIPELHRMFGDSG